MKKVFGIVLMILVIATACEKSGDPVKPAAQPPQYKEVVGVVSAYGFNQNPGMADVFAETTKIKMLVGGMRFEKSGESLSAGVQNATVSGQVTMASKVNVSMPNGMTAVGYTNLTMNMQVLIGKESAVHTSFIMTDKYELYYNEALNRAIEQKFGSQGSASGYIYPKRVDVFFEKDGSIRVEADFIIVEE